VGFCAVEITPDLDKRAENGRVVDLLTLPDRLDIADALIQKALRELTHRNLHTITCLMVGKHPYAKILERHGFVTTGRKSGLFFNQRVPGLEDEFDKLVKSSPERVHVCHGDFP
jgi:hypothetical protein